MYKVDSVYMSKFKIVIDKDYMANWTRRYLKLSKWSKLIQWRTYWKILVGILLEDSTNTNSTSLIPICIEKVLCKRENEVKWLRFDNSYNLWIHKDNSPDSERAYNDVNAYNDIMIWIYYNLHIIYIMDTIEF